MVRMQLQMVQQLGDAVRLTPDDRRRALDLDDDDWGAWTEFLIGRTSLPERPPLPDMLLRAGQVAFHLAVVAELRAGKSTQEAGQRPCA